MQSLDPNWPNSDASVFVRVGGLTWHVQDLGSGPPILLVHGTGSASHSWRDVAPLLARNYRVLVPDLPGHGFTTSPPFAGFSLPAMARALQLLLRELDVGPVIAVGHSAGAAVLARMTLSHYVTPKVIISINGALLPLSGLPRWIFSPLAKLLARTELVPRWMAGRAANPEAIRRLIEDTGSKLDAKGLQLYQQVVRRPEHVAAALAMMANWDLSPLVAGLPDLRTPLKLLVANNDRTISPTTAQRVRALVPTAEVIPLGDYGHLVHEEQPRRVAEEIDRLATESDPPTYDRESAEGPWQPHLMRL
jgi:magnesium chelatase accessory protein